MVQEVSPLSNPLLLTSEALADGVTALEAADSGPLPAGFDAVTVNVYVVPLVNPVTVVLVGAGFPVTVVVVCGVEPIYGVMTYDVAGHRSSGPPADPCRRIAGGRGDAADCPGAGDGVNTGSTQ